MLSSLLPWIGRYWRSVCLYVTDRYVNRNLHKIIAIATRIREHPGEAHGMGLALAQFDPKLDDISTRLAVRVTLNSITATC